MRSLTPRWCLVVLCACSGNDAPAVTPSAPRAAAIPDGAPVAAAPAPMAASGGTGTALTVDMATPYFAATKAANLFALEQWAPARTAFKSMLRDAKPELAPRIRLMIALCDARLDAHAAAAAGFERAIEELPILADFARYHAASSRFFAHDLDAAHKLARAVDPKSIHAADAELLAGDILRSRGRWKEVAEHYAGYLERRPKGIRRAEARFRLGQAYEKLGRPATDAIAEYRAITIRAPLTSWATQAQKRIDALRGGLSAADRARVTTLTADELIERGMIYYDSMRNELSEADFDAALRAPGLTDDAACVAGFHRANSVFKQRNRTRAAPLFDEASTLCAKTSNVDLQVKSAYQAGRSYANIGEHDKAVERYLAAEKHTDHSYADDARMRQAEEYADLGKDAKVTELLASIPDRYPTGDMRAEAIWRLGWRAYKAKDWSGAIKWFKKQIATVPIDDNFWAEGQPQYWLGRTYARMGKARESLAAYEQAIRTYPLSYYALLALNRMREDHPKRFADLTAELAKAPAGFDPAAPAFTFSPDPIYSEPGFQRALELLRLGLGDRAATELAQLGLVVPDGKKRVEDAAQIERLWAMAFLYDAAGRHGEAHWVTRWHILDYKRSWPVGHNLARWRISYPRAWWDLLERHAKKNGFPTELLISFVREESAFDPLRESFANAIGLTQMIFPTARRFAKGTGIEVNRRSLRDPESNVTIGARFLDFLMDRFGARVALVVPSYNAGEGATGKWLEARGSWPVDEWAEEIPYDETRNYSKRVISSYFAYSYLDDGDIPAMPNDIPAKLRP